MSRRSIASVSGTEPAATASATPAATPGLRGAVGELAVAVARDRRLVDEEGERLHRQARPQHRHERGVTGSRRRRARSSTPSRPDRRTGRAPCSRARRRRRRPRNTPRSAWLRRTSVERYPFGMATTIAVDIGGTKLAAAIVDEDDGIVANESTPRPARPRRRHALRRAHRRRRLTSRSTSTPARRVRRRMRRPDGRVAASTCRRSTSPRGATSRCAPGSPRTPGCRRSSTTTPRRSRSARAGSARRRARATTSGWSCRRGSAAASCSTAGSSTAPTATPATSAT